MSSQLLQVDDPDRNDTLLSPSPRLQNGIRVRGLGCGDTLHSGSFQDGPRPQQSFSLPPRGL